MPSDKDKRERKDKKRKSTSSSDELPQAVTCKKLELDPSTAVELVKRLLEFSTNQTGQSNNEQQFASEIDHLRQILLLHIDGDVSFFISCAGAVPADDRTPTLELFYRTPDFTMSFELWKALVEEVLNSIILSAARRSLLLENNASIPKETPDFDHFAEIQRTFHSDLSKLEVHSTTSSKQIEMLKSALLITP